MSHRHFLGLGSSWTLCSQMQPTPYSNFSYFTAFSYSFTQLYFTLRWSKDTPVSCPQDTQGSKLEN